VRLTWSQLVVLSSIALLVLAAVVLVRASNREQARDHSAAATSVAKIGSPAPEPSRRERCKRKCAMIRKGYVYRAEQHLQGVGNADFRLDFCSCV